MYMYILNSFRKRDSSKPGGQSQVGENDDQYLNTAHLPNQPGSSPVTNPIAGTQPPSQPVQEYEEVPQDMPPRTLNGTSPATPQEYESVPRHYENREDWNRPYEALK